MLLLQTDQVLKVVEVCRIDKTRSVNKTYVNIFKVEIMKDFKNNLINATRSANIQYICT